MLQIRKAHVSRGLVKYWSKLRIPSSITSTTKPDKINALRKQYEDFLAEDKKRKERNQYILGRLDRIQSCTSLVPHIKPARIINARQSGPSIPLPYSERFVSPLYSMQHAGVHTLSPATGNPTKGSEETPLLQEIITKYILIPKRDYYNTSIDGNNDWQSKYEILNHIKNIGKEESGDVPIRDETFLKSDLNQDIEAIYKREPPVLDNELPVKDLSAAGIQLDSSLQYGNKEIDKPIDKTLDNTFTKLSTDYSYLQNNVIPKVSKNVNDIQHDDIQLNSAIENLNIVSHNDYKINHQNPNIVPSHSASPQRETSMHAKQDQKPVEDSKEVFLDGDNYSYIQTMNTHEVAEVYVERDVKDSKEIDNMEYPIEMLSVSEFTPNEGVELEDGVNVNPEGYHVYGVSASMYNNEPQASNNSYESNVEVANPIQTIQSEIQIERSENIVPAQISNEILIDQDESPPEPMVVPNTVNDTDIAEFEAEQNDMFYKEQPEESAEYQQETDGYNSENYQQKEYQYYEGEQERPVEINEHEETSQMYDQNYTAQYETAYQQPQKYEQVYDQQGYEQQQQVYQQNEEGYGQHPVYEQQQIEYNQEQQVYSEGQQQAYNQQQLYDPQQVEYDQQAGYEQQSYDQLQQQNYETPENIEHQLDDEERYNEPKQIKEDKVDDIKPSEKVKEAMQNPS